LPADLPDVRVDLTRIHHVFSNLLSNALKYTPPGGTSLCLQRLTKSGRVLRRRYRSGIPSIYLPRIFEQFFRVPDQGKETGAGFGLAIVKEIVEAHGGAVGVESHEGKGSTFTFTLRRADRVSGEENHS